MDIPGWHAQRRARREDELLSIRRPDSRYFASRRHQSDALRTSLVALVSLKLHPHPHPHAPYPHPHAPYPPPPPSPLPPALPPKDEVYTQPGYHYPTQSTITSSQLTHLSAVERSQTLRVARMYPHLQAHTTPSTSMEFGTGAAMIVTADSGSIYEPHPTLTYEWDPDASASYQSPQPARSFDLGPHPADPHSTIMPVSPVSIPPNMFTNGSGNGRPTGGNASKEVVPGQEIYVYGGPGGTFTFWRFLLQIPLGRHEMSVTYSINSGQQLEFFVPGRTQNMRWAAHSCNGFSAGVNQDDFCGPGFKSGYDPVWIDLLSKHAEEPFHALVGAVTNCIRTGPLMREPELQEWVSKMKPEEKKRFPITEEIYSTIDRFYFNHYCQAFRRGAFARANSSIPMMNMCDDHDIIDGFGSYPDDLQKSTIFQTIGERGYFYFLLFQCFINPGVDGYSDEPGRHVSKSVIIGDEGPYVRSRSHSFLGYLGPQSYILLLDCRGERRKDQICSSLQYQKVFHRLSQLPQSVEHLIVQVGIPIAYPRMVFLEAALESKLNPLVALGRTGTLGLSGFVNKFNAEAELLDDLNDHWTARSHKKERNWFIEQLQLFALRQRIRVSFVSGDVHCAAVGVLKTLKAKGRSELAPATDHRYMLNIVSSAIVNTPPPNPVISMVSTLATKVHKTLHHIETDETMMPIFQNETNGQPRKQKFIMGRRNWCKVVWEPQTGDLIFDIRVEKEKGLGETVGYSVHTPPPAWARGN
ncbi:hypothetical protein FPV67DRAFT_1563868 [Lyophyllum atratum]|nr:hypothetical protein FPV67DRAFT_1563868 [Lyophyllum atratum]